MSSRLVTAPTAAATRTAPGAAGSGDVPAEAAWALSRALIPRGETRHLRTCLARHVNSTTYPCSPDCLRAQKALRGLTALVEANRRPAPARQVRLVEEVAG